MTQAYPYFFREYAEMIDTDSLETKTARAVARKAGLRRAPDGTASAARVRTIIDAWVMPEARPFLYQWFVDLSGFSKWRFTSQASNFTRLYFSLDLSDTLDPGDWDWNLGTQSADEGVGNDLFWSDIPEELRGPVRLLVEVQDFAVNSRFVDGPFTVAVEAY